MSPITSTDLGVRPERVDPVSIGQARKLLERDGAVIITGLEPVADSLTVAAAQVLGNDLRELFPYRRRRSQDSKPVHLHADSFDVMVDIAGVPVKRRDPNEDFVLIQSILPAVSGGDNFAIDAYRFLDDCATADPWLWEFLTGSDVDLYGAWAGMRGLPATPRVGRHVEYTRTGRKIMRRGDGAAPLRRDPDDDYIETALAHFNTAVLALEDTLPRFRLDAGEILLLDNFRCWHGRDAHAGDRVVQILTMRSALSV